VADGPSSSLTIGTDNIPLGSYNMELVIYHCRGKDKFIPLGYASTVFSITGDLLKQFPSSYLGEMNIQLYPSLAGLIITALHLLLCL